MWHPAPRAWCPEALVIRTLIVGDVHGCARPLERLLAKAGADRVVLVGDLFSKGPDPRGVWKLLREVQAESVLGNQDVAVLERWKPGKRLPGKALAWLAERPLFLRGDGWVVVHAGVHPEHGVEGTRRRHLLGLRRWPTDKARNPYWWDLYRGHELVIHGHDAATGLRDLRPWSLGLDTGCVYGGRLTGYLVEEDCLISVQGQK